MSTTNAPATEERACPKCGGRTWDNRLTKRNPKAPDFKCRDRGCDGVIWPDREGDAQQELAPPPAPPPAPAPAPRAQPAQRSNAQSNAAQSDDPRAKRIAAARWALREAKTLAAAEIDDNLEVTAGDIVAIAGLLLK